MKVLIIGSAPESLGEEIGATLQSIEGCAGREVITAGLSGEDYALDITSASQIMHVLNEVRPSHIVCTAGVNSPARIGVPWYIAELKADFKVNCLGVMDVLHTWLRYFPTDNTKTMFAAISSNSANIPRTNSGPYCTSKAALSMAMRVAARELRGDPIVWTYEPGYVAGTPMSKKTEYLLDSGPLHRIPGVPDRGGLDKEEIANHFVALMLNGGIALNGATIRMDGGEL